MAPTAAPLTKRYRAATGTVKAAQPAAGATQASALALYGHCEGHVDCDASTSNTGVYVTPSADVDSVMVWMPTLATDGFSYTHNRTCNGSVRTDDSFLTNCGRTLAGLGAHDLLLVGVTLGDRLHDRVPLPDRECDDIGDDVNESVRVLDVVPDVVTDGDGVMVMEWVSDAVGVDVTVPDAVVVTEVETDGLNDAVNDGVSDGDDVSDSDSVPEVVTLRVPSSEPVELGDVEYEGVVDDDTVREEVADGSDELYPSAQ